MKDGKGKMEKDGIERYMVRKEDKKDYEGHKGKMSEKGNAQWSRKGSQLTPRKA